MFFLPGAEEEMLASSKKYADSKGFVLNPDTKMLSAVIKSLARNLEEKGKPYCPCRALTGNKEEDGKAVCPCAFHLDEIRQDGHCKCRLFWKKQA